MEFQRFSRAFALGVLFFTFAMSQASLALAQQKARPISLEDFYRRIASIQSVEGCGRTHICSSPKVSRRCEERAPHLGEYIIWGVISWDEQNTFALALVPEGKISLEYLEDGREKIIYQELRTYPSNPGLDPEYRRRYHLEYVLSESKIEAFYAFVEEYLPDTKAWEPVSESDLSWTNPLICP